MPLGPAPALCRPAVAYSGVRRLGGGDVSRFQYVLSVLNFVCGWYKNNCIHSSFWLLLFLFKSSMIRSCRALMTFMVYNYGTIDGLVTCDIW